MANHEQLATSYDHIQSLASHRDELCREWLRYAIVHKGCLTQTKALQQRLDSKNLSQEELNNIGKELEEAWAPLKEWYGRRKELDNLFTAAQMVIKDRASRRVVHFQTETEAALSAYEKATHQLKQRQGKLDEASEKWQLFENQKQALLASLQQLSEKVQACSPREPSLGGLKDMTRELKECEKELSAHNPDLDALRALGQELKTSDSARVRDELGDVETQWDTVHSLVNDRLQSLSALTVLWTQYDQSLSAVRRVLTTAQPLIEKERNFTEQDEVKRALEQFKVIQSSLLI